jgi:hypothetical protein
MYPFAVDPTKLPEHLNDAQLEYFILFSILVAGKSAKQTYKKLNNFIERNLLNGAIEVDYVITPTPFEIIRRLHLMGELGAELETEKFGQYKRIRTAFEKVIELDIQDLSVEKLEAIPGIGPKTARFIMLYSDPSFNGVPLDTHILKFLAAIYNDVPKSTPPAGRLYERLEYYFQFEARAQNKTVRQLDTEVWQHYNKG